MADHGRAASVGVDILDNNAALTDADVLARDTTVTEMDIEVWDQMMAVNLRSQMLMCKHAVPAHGRRAAAESIVNMSSGAANTGDLTRTAYSVSKAGDHDAHQVRGDPVRPPGRPGQRASCPA